MANKVFPCDGKPSGTRNLTTLNWRDLISSSSWKDANYKRTAIASLIQAVYFLELDRQENRTQENALAPNCWLPFNYKLTRVLIDERDGSIFGAIFEWDRFAALTDLVPFRPKGAPRAVLALRGTLIRYPTIRRDFEDDFRFFAWESLKGSVRFNVALDAVKSVSDTYGRRNVCIAGHSLGAGIGLQVGKELAEEGINVEAHFFNPPAVSLAMSLGNIGEKTEYVWNTLKSMFPSGNEAQVSNDGDKTYGIRLKRLIPRLSSLMDAYFGSGKWVPHLYVNSNDWISFFYVHSDGKGEIITDMENMSPTNEQNAAKLFVVSKEDQKFHEAHSLKQWWASDAEFQQDIHNGKLTRRHLKSLNTCTPSQVILFYYPYSVSVAMGLIKSINIKETTDFVWSVLKYVPHLSGKAQVSSDVDNTLGVGLKAWIPQLYGLNDADYWVGKWVPHLYANKNDGKGEKMVEKENMGSTNAAQLFVVSKEQQKFLAAHGLEQWWPTDAEIQLAIHNSKFISRQVRSLYTSTPWKVTQILNPSSVSLALSLSNIGEREEFVWKWNSLKSMLPSDRKAQVSNNGDKASGVPMKSWIPPLSSLKDAGFTAGKWVPQMYSNNSHYISSQLRSFYSITPSQVPHLFNIPSVSPAMSLGNTGENAKFMWSRLQSMSPSSSEAQISNDADKTSGAGLKSWIPLLSGMKDASFGVDKLFTYLHVNKGGGPEEKMVDKENPGASQATQGKPQVNNEFTPQYAK